jgi:hypothetical protein
MFRSDPFAPFAFPLSLLPAQRYLPVAHRARSILPSCLLLLTSPLVDTCVPTRLTSMFSLSTLNCSAAGNVKCLDLTLLSPHLGKLFAKRACLI